MDFDDLDDVAPVEDEQTGQAEEDEEKVEVTLWLPNTGQTITIPVTKKQTVKESRESLSQMYGIDAPCIHLGLAEGGYVNYYDDDDLIADVGKYEKICVKGIYEFDNARTMYPHPFMVIGGGHNGCRQAAEYQRRKIDFTLFERKDRFGGNAWATIANDQSRLQSEACSYQIQWDPFDGAGNAIWKNSEFNSDKGHDQDNHWPSRKRICENYTHWMDEYKVPYKLNTEIVKMNIHHEEEGEDLTKKYYDMHWESKIDDDDEGVYRVSCLCAYPGAMCHGRRHKWPGEDEFGGVVGYGFSNEFPYEEVKEKVGIIIGMGAFFAENVRTACEYGTKKLIGVCRHFNLMCPRVCSWTMSISYAPASAAEILNTMKPMYELAGLPDPWDWWSIQNKDEGRTKCSIKQYTRWGVGDIYFLALYYKRCEMITGEVERFLPLQAKLNTGKTIDIYYVIKVLGFLSDFGMDKLMQCEKMLGPWPEGDWRRWVSSDQSEIDANRFSSLGLAYHAASLARQSLWYHEHPKDADRVLEAGVLTWNYAEPELGLTAYHYHPRKGTSNFIMISKFCPVLDSFFLENDLFRVQMYNEQASPSQFLRGCAKDWDKYCEMFRSYGDTHIEKPPYPYTLEMLEGIVDRGTMAEQYYLDYKTHRENGKELLGFVPEVEAGQR